MGIKKITFIFRLFFAIIVTFGSQSLFSWESIKEINGWEKNNENLPSYIRERFRYNPKQVADMPSNRIVFCVLHGDGNGAKNVNFFDLNSDGFRGILRYTQEYLDDYNKKYGTNKVLHILSYRWNGNLTYWQIKAEGKKLAQFLHNSEYRESCYSFLGYSHGCNVANEALQELADVQTDKGKIADQLIYFFPPCRAPFSGSFSWLNKIFGNFLSAPTRYNNLLLFYSKKDLVALGGAIDEISGSFCAAAICNVFFQAIFSKEKIFALNKTKTISFGALLGGLSLVLNRVVHARYYPDEKVSNTRGKNRQIRLLLDGKDTDHDIKGLFQHLSNITNKLEAYADKSANNSFFTANIETSGDVQLSLIK